jgi:hypothetical protein
MEPLSTLSRRNIKSSRRSLKIRKKRKSKKVLLPKNLLEMMPQLKVKQYLLRKRRRRTKKRKKSLNPNSSLRSLTQMTSHWLRPRTSTSFMATSIMPEASSSSMMVRPYLSSGK